MALVKRKTRKKLSKQLARLIKRHGAEMALALVTGIISNLTTDAAGKSAKKKKAKSAKQPKNTTKRTKTAKASAADGARAANRSR
jgi:uncharacterized membrane protein YoaK (UPF0700 family)